MILGQRKSKELTLEDLIDKGNEWGLFNGNGITVEGLSYQVLNRGYELFEKIFYELKDIALNLPRIKRKKVLKEFDKISILDSSTVSLSKKLIETFRGTKNNSALKIHVRFDLGNKVVEDFKISKAKDHDKKHALYEVYDDKKTLYLTDLGYTDYRIYSIIDGNEDKFVVRVKSNSTCKVLKDLSGRHMEVNGKSLDDLLSLSNNQSDKSLDLLVVLSNGLVVRYIRFYDIEDGKYYTYYTNLKDVSEWSKEEIRKLYTLRWSIEIFFRELKHYLGCIKIIFREERRVKSQIYASFCLYLLVRIFMLLSSYQNGRDLDSYSFKYCLRIIYRLFVIVVKGFNINDVLKLIIKEINIKGLKKSKKHLQKKKKRLI